MSNIESIFSSRLNSFLEILQISLAPLSTLTNSRYGSQFLYGHRELLLKWAQLSPNSLIIGDVQHGVMAPNEQTMFRSKRYRFGKRAPYYVWSSSVAQVATNVGFSNIRVISSPWCYLSKPTKFERNKKKILIAPAHTTLSDSVSDKHLFAQQARHFRDVVGKDDATVLLYWLDFLDRDILRSYENEGFDVITNGYPGIGNTDTLLHESRINFLPNLMTLINSFDALLTNSFSTPLFYAMDLGLPVRFVQDLTVKALSNKHAFKPNTYLRNNLAGYELLKRLSPEILNDFSCPSNSNELLSLTLGRGEELTKSQLSAVLWVEENPMIGNLNL